MSTSLKRSTPASPAPRAPDRRRILDLLAAAVWPLITVAIVVLGTVGILGQPRSTESLGPSPDADSYTAQALEFSMGNFLGGIPSVEDGVAAGEYAPSRYPPGLPLVLSLAPTLHGGGEADVLTASALLSILLMVAAAATAQRIAGWPAAAVAAALTLASPFVWFASRIVMGDVFGALCAVVVLYFVHAAWTATTGRWRTVAWVAAGAAAGLGVMSRLSLVVLVIAAVVAVRRPRDVIPLALGGLPFAIALAGYQWYVFGSPLTTGYDYYYPDLQEFDADNPITWDQWGDGPWIYPDQLNGALFQWMCPCPYNDGGVLAHTPPILTYPFAVLGLYWVVTPPLVLVAGLVWVVRRLRSGPERFAFVLLIGHLVLFAFYTFQGIRFIAPATAVLTVFSAVALVTWTGTGLRRLRGRSGELSAATGDPGTAATTVLR